MMHLTANQCLKSIITKFSLLPAGSQEVVKEWLQISHIKLSKKMPKIKNQMGALKTQDQILKTPDQEVSRATQKQAASRECPKQEATRGHTKGRNLELIQVSRVF